MISDMPPNTTRYPQRHPPCDHAGSKTSTEMLTSRAAVGHEQITDRTELSFSASQPPREYSNNYTNAVPHLAQSMDVLSNWGLSSAVPFLQYDQSLAKAVPMDFNVNPNNNTGADASLDILNAESYDDYEGGGMGNSNKPSKRTQMGDAKPLLFGMTTGPQGDSTSSNPPDMNADEQDGRRKKKARVEVLSEEDEAMKKARGRPRIDTKDETAVDVSVDSRDYTNPCFTI